MTAGQIVSATLVFYTLICACVVAVVTRQRAARLERLEKTVRAHENMIDINGMVLDALKSEAKPLRHPDKGKAQCYREPAPRCRHCGQVLS
jgi:hypothetical protein